MWSPSSGRLVVEWDHHRAKGCTYSALRYRPEWRRQPGRLAFKGAGNISSAVQHDRSPADGYFKTALFGDVVCPTTVNFGLWCDSPTGRNTMIGPGFVDFDFGVAKKFKMTERVAFQLQVNLFNLFNHPNFQNPVGNLNNAGQFGKSIATYDPGVAGARVTQLSLRLDF